PPLTNTYTISLHDALPISTNENARGHVGTRALWGGSRSLKSGRIPEGHDREHQVVIDIRVDAVAPDLILPAHEIPAATWVVWSRSEEHTSELQSLAYLVCR